METNTNNNKNILIMSLSQPQIQPRPTRSLLNQKQVESFLSECGLSQYFDTFIEEGFDRLESVRIYTSPKE
jgi:hypothetical protein